MGKSDKKWLVTYIPLIVLLGSLFFNYMQYTQNKNQFEENINQRIQLDSIKYIENALTFRPRLELMGKPTIDRMQISFDKEVFNPFFTPDSIINDTIGAVKGKITLTSSFMLINKGNAIAKIQLQSLTDTFTTAPILRKRLFDAIKSGKIKFEYFDDYYNLDIGKDDSTNITIKKDIQFLKGDEVNLHFIVFYENEFGHLYDTYIWAVFDKIPTIFRPKIGYDEKNKRIFGVIEEQYKADKFRCKRVKTESNFYDKKTANTFKRAFESAFKEAKENKDTLDAKL